MNKVVIELQNIKRNFQVGDETVHALRGVSFTIREGEFVTIMGTSGSGKSTLLKLAARFCDPASGAVKLGGADISHASPESYYENVSMAFQDVYLFKDTVENNIRYGREDATHEEVVAAAKAARCHGFIEALPQGYRRLSANAGRPFPAASASASR